MRNITHWVLLVFACVLSTQSLASKTITADSCVSMMAAPTVTSVGVPSNGVYGPGEVLNFTVNFSEPVTVASSSPIIDISVGVNTVTAFYNGGTGSSSLDFQYTVSSGFIDSDGIVLNALSTNGATIQNSSGEDADLTLNAVGDTTGVLIDGIRPAVVSVTAPAAGTYSTGNAIDVTINFDEPVFISTTGASPVFNFVVGQSGASANYLSGSGSQNLTFRYVVQSGLTDSDGIASNLVTVNSGVSDAKGNPNNSITIPLVIYPGVFVDSELPKVTSVGVPTAGFYTPGEFLDFVVNFDDNVIVDSSTGTPRLDIIVGSTTVAAAYLSGSGTSALTFRYIVQTGDIDYNGIQIDDSDLNGGTIKDALGNSSQFFLINQASTFDILVGASQPIVTSVTVPSPGTYQAGAQLDFQVNFSEIVNVSGTSSFINMVVDNVTGPQRAQYVSGSGSTTLTYSYTVPNSTFEDLDGIELGTIEKFGNTFTNAAGAPADLTLNNIGNVSAINIDAVRPQVTSVTVPADGTYDTGDLLSFTVNFDETVIVTGTGSTLPIRIGFQNKPATYVSGSGTSSLLYTYTVESGLTDSNGIQIFSMSGAFGLITDQAGNAYTNSLNGVPDLSRVLIDSTRPFVSSVNPPSNGTYRSGAVLNYTLTFDRSVNVNLSGGTPSLELIVGNTTRQANYTSGSGSSSLVFTYTVVTADNDTDGIERRDINLNGGSIVSNSFDARAINTTISSPFIGNILVDNELPTITSVGVPAANTYFPGDNLDFAINFTEDVYVDGGTNPLKLSLDVGGSTKLADYFSGFGTSTLTFRYTVEAGINDADGIMVGSMALNGTTIRDLVGNLANIGLNNVGDTQNVFVNDAAAGITSVNVPASNTYLPNDNLTFTVFFDEIVFVDTTLGSPELYIVVGTTTRAATYVAGTGTNSLVFRYTVQPFENDADGIELSSLSFNGATINNARNNNSVLDLVNVGSTTGILIDDGVPTVTSVTASADGIYIGGQTIQVFVNYDENVIVTTGGLQPSVGLNIGGTIRVAAYSSGSGTSTLVFQYTVQTGDSDLDGISIDPLMQDSSRITSTLNTAANPNLLNIADTSGILIANPITSFPYSQDFESGRAGWVSGGTNSSWQLGTPSIFTNIPGAASGTNAWVTNLSGTYNNDENSYVVSPIFDFSGLVRDPELSMQIFYDIEEGDYDGAAIQTSIDGGVTWQIVGSNSSGTRPYEGTSIDGGPGGQGLGWFGENGLNGPADYVTAKNTLIGLAGQPAVQIRVVFGSDGSVNYDGFAFDDVTITEPIVDYTYTTGAGWSPNAPDLVSNPITSVDNLIINGDTNLPSAITAKNLTVNTGVTLTLDTGNLTITGNVVNNGTIAGISKLIMTGSPSTVGGTGTVDNLEINTSTTATIIGDLSIANYLTIPAGRLITNDKLTFKSSANRTAGVGPLPLAPINPTIDGQVNVERYIPVKRGFRFLSSSVDGGSVFDNWQEAGSNTAGFGTHITGTAGTPGGIDPVTGHDLTATGRSSMFTYSSTWNAVANTKTTNLNVGNAYRLFVRGDRTIDLTQTSSNQTASETILRSSGTVKQGTHQSPVAGAAGDFLLVGNPWQSKINFQQVVDAAVTGIIQARYYVWDASAGDLGAYTAFTFSSGINSLMGSDANQFLEAGQSAFVESTAIGAGLTFLESNKVDNTAAIGTLSTPSTTTTSLLQIGLFRSGDDLTGVARAGLLNSFVAGANNGVDQNDGAAFFGPGENLFVLNGTDYLAVNEMDVPVDNDRIQLHISNITSTDYDFQFLLNNISGINAYFVDAFTGTRHLLDSTTMSVVSATINSAIPGSIDTLRFSMEFEDSTLGLDDSAFAKAVTLYPNPIHDGILTISYPAAAAQVKASIYNMQGQLVKTINQAETKAAARLQVNVDGLSTGIYTISLEIDGNKVVKKFIKN
jgi:hypothetical protein